MKNEVPQHIAIIMDGNGRWAKQQNKPRVFGHQNGVKAVRSVVKKSAELGVKSLTLFAFSSENIKRQKSEIDLLFSLFLTVLQSEVKKLLKNNIRLKFIGDLSIFPKKVQKLAHNAEQKLSQNTGLELIVAANYGGKWDITQACQQIKGEITEAKIANNLAITQNIDLVIRTSGEQRISNFLLWQCAYSEFYFTETMWPDFNDSSLQQAIKVFNNRERRFGVNKRK